jgi:hypothetical protein
MAVNEILKENVRFIRYWCGTTLIYMLPFPYRKYHAANVAKGHVPRNPKVLDDFVKHMNPPRALSFRFTKDQLLNIDFETAYNNETEPF